MKTLCGKISQVQFISPLGSFVFNAVRELAVYQCCICHHYHFSILTLLDIPSYPLKSVNEETHYHIQTEAKK